MIQDPDLVVRIDDDLPYAQQQLQNADGTVFPIPTGSTVKFGYRKYAQSGGFTEGDGAITDAPTGLVRYQFDPLLLTEPGQYSAYWVVVLTDGSRMTFPNGRDLWLQVTRRS